ncbi:MAG: ATP-binding cassette domain-containing protein [Heyndrickxia sp.]
MYQFKCIGIVGKNGAEKSIQLKLIKGQCKPQVGHVKRIVDIANLDQLVALC